MILNSEPVNELEDVAKSPRGINSSSTPVVPFRNEEREGDVLKMCAIMRGIHE